ncbi:hypothetical protein [Craterilacuibacter sinensis]|uniref:Uncharacterized protein n=1 Tax=Craterilacuibacter sinensis TaxID=2686017 RepID=A0A845BST0_9NEIS|nr:hypothetical protein [Craterilacuibacter sinensis]MXR35633.1 hypothetical protein [Craterilacuibacter sinensis]
MSALELPSPRMICRGLFFYGSTIIRNEYADNNQVLIFHGIKLLGFDFIWHIFGIIPVSHLSISLLLNNVF